MPYAHFPAFIKAKSNILHLKELMAHHQRKMSQKAYACRLLRLVNFARALHRNADLKFPRKTTNVVPTRQNRASKFVAVVGGCLRLVRALQAHNELLPAQLKMQDLYRALIQLRN